MKLKPTTLIAAAIAVACIILFCGCSKPEFVKVRCITVHYYGIDEPKNHFSSMTVERLDTHERRVFSLIMAKPGDEFTINWNQPHYE